ncbi:MAG: family 1 glycosylhydrolase [Conexivisphaerales archaeon]
MLVGVSTSSYQNEEDCLSSDWYYWEKMGKLPKKGKSTMSYKNFEKDIELLKQIRVNAYRFSIEFSRIMPSINKIDREALEHYKLLIKSLINSKIEPVVTLWHYTLPFWLSKNIGLESEKSFSYFMDYVKTLVYNEVLEGVKYVLTMNEPSLFSLMAYLFGIYPPMKKSIISYIRVSRNLIKLHNVIYSFLKEQGFTVSYAQNIEYYANFIFDYPLSLLLSYILNYRFLDEMKKDFIGVNYYGKIIPLEIIGGRGVNGGRLLSPKEDPDKLKYILSNLHHRYNLPIMITENGIATDDEDRRINYIKKHTDIVKNFAKRYNIMGYFYWTLEDNYEWKNGYKRRYGLFTIKRKPKASVNFFKKVVEELKSAEPGIKI